MEIASNNAAVAVSPLSALISMFYEPSATFQRLEPRPRAWVPLLLLIISSVAVMSWYFAVVDFPWLMDQFAGALKTVEEREAFAKTMTKSVLHFSTVASVVVMFPLMFAISGVYLMIVSKSMSQGMSFGKAFALSTWASVPGLLMLPLGAMQIMLNPSGQLEMSALNPLSLNQLVFHYDMAHPMAGLMDALSVTTFWSMFLMMIGFEVWAKVKRSTAVLVVGLPYLVIFGGWAAFVMATNS
ncbi:YIP1 family protein [Massilia sp. PAMC28688]|uniref:YIP1 family protein n=1 Tax=Massilia sp. PAMC28688 TaxID=2861283 RepID=UPI001C629730|nr:YIP1 family protein [Massilia sp. PAMC28688]QYF95189.1 YIP1 family protein [Massilia sp. PAMC28688]